MKKNSSVPQKSTHRIRDKGQFAIDFPEKFYMGSFCQEDKFEARAENDGLFIKLIRTGDEKRKAEVHLHHQLLADVLTEWAHSLRHEPSMEKEHKRTLLKALKAVEKALT
jgi:hypothetical protein